jgi:3-phosphoshikimate 1-carboxyvinyltransferase
MTPHSANPQALPTSVHVHSGPSLHGEVSVPGDKSISHRMLLIGALAAGETRVRGISDGDDVVRTERVVEAIGGQVRRDGPNERTVIGGVRRLHEPQSALDFGNSGTGMRLTTGLLAGFPWRCTLVGDASLSSRPMDRIAAPLEAMGAQVRGHGPRACPPLTVVGGDLKAITWRPPVASAQVKSAILFAGLHAQGTTVVEEPVATRTHTEDLFALAGADIEVERAGVGLTVRLRPSHLSPLDIEVPGDPSQGAFWIVAGCIVPASSLVVRHLYAGAERVGFLGVLERMGALLERRAAGEGVVDVAVRTGALRATTVEADEIPSLDEVPILAVAAACAEGVTVFRDVGELRLKETDRLAATARLVRALGAAAAVVGDELHVEGVGPKGRLRPAHFDAEDDHRLAMAAVVGALCADPTATASRISGFGGVATSYPQFLADLERVAGGGTCWSIAEVPRVIAIDGPAGAGKSTVSTLLSERLGFDRLDTGAMYRAVTWAAIEAGLDLSDAPALERLAAALDLEMGTVVRADGVDVTEAIRTPAINAAVSRVAATPSVRTVLVEHQRSWARVRDGVVVEGRDIGTVVFPDAALKIFLTASPEERSRRRAEEPDLERRDHVDTTRAASPLAQAHDARVIDTTERGVDEVLEEILSWL